MKYFAYMVLILPVNFVSFASAPAAAAARVSVKDKASSAMQAKMIERASGASAAKNNLARSAQISPKASSAAGAAKEDAEQAFSNEERELRHEMLLLEDSFGEAFSAEYSQTEKDLNQMAKNSGSATQGEACVLAHQFGWAMSSALAQSDVHRKMMQTEMNTMKRWLMFTMVQQKMQQKELSLQKFEHEALKKELETLKAQQSLAAKHLKRRNSH